MQGKGFWGSKSLERKKNEGRGRKKKKSEAKALPNRNRGLFPTSLPLLALYPVQQSVSFSSFSFLFVS